MTTRFADHFSGHAAQYARYRPTYPESLFEFLARRAPARRLAWDCATGSGQAAVALARGFDRVVATDGSWLQLRQAIGHERVGYAQAVATAPPLDDESCDLVTVAQALHWFAGEPFYAEVLRVAVPGGLFAAWSYGLLRVSRRVDALVDRFAEDTVGAYWPPERALVDAGYRGIELPFDELRVPSFAMTWRWTVDQAISYLRTWSAVRRFEAERGFEPVAAVEGELQSIWGEGERRVDWPLVVRVARVD